MAFTLSIALFHVVLFEAAWVLGGDDGVKSLFDAGYLYYGDLRQGAWWQVLTSGVVHRDWDHLLWNTLYLVLLGIKLEPMIGSAATARVYLVSQVATSIPVVVFHGGSGGASGAVLGLAGVVLARPFGGQGEGRQILSRTWPLFLVCYAFGFQGEPVRDIAFGSHLAGFLAGLLFGAFIPSRKEVAWRPSGRRFTAVGAAALALVVAVAPLEYWTVEWQFRGVHAALLKRDGAAARAELLAIERTADPRSPHGAEMLELVANMHRLDGDLVRAQTILGQVAPTLDEADVFREYGLLQTMTDPGDPRGAEASFRRALELEPADPRTLNALAMLFVFGDSTQYSPARARALARSAIAEDGALTMEYFVTLAWADYECGDESEAIDRMRYVVQADTTDRDRRLGDLRFMERTAADRS